LSRRVWVSYGHHRNNGYQRRENFLCAPYPSEGRHRLTSSREAHQKRVLSYADK
jgi:hypothetical protein